MDYPPNEQPYHIEQYVSVDKISHAENVKQQAFHAMNELEGWCTKQKAAILIDLCLMLQPETVVEIGVFGGKSLVPMAFAVRQNGHGRVYGIDPWDNQKSIVGMDGVNYQWWDSIDHEKIYNGLVAKLHKFQLVNSVSLVKATSEDAELIADIDILHIDGNHAEETSILDATKWVPCVRKGGLVIFDDVTWGTTKKAVEWMDATCTKMVEYQDVGNNWAIWIKN